MSRFVRAGASVDDTSSETTATNEDTAWRKAQEQVAAVRNSQQHSQSQQGSQDAGKSLYQVLQENKAAKQEAFEEAAKLKNQFRPLDQSEVEFLDAVEKASREKEEALKRELAEQLDLFRQRQAEAEKMKATATGRPLPDDGGANGQGEDNEASSTWTISNKKRKRDKTSSTQSSIPGLKQRRTSDLEAADRRDLPKTNLTETSDTSSETLPTTIQSSVTIGKRKDAHIAGNGTVSPVSDVKGGSGLGLGAYSSDED